MKKYLILCLVTLVILFIFSNIYDLFEKEVSPISTLIARLLFLPTMLLPIALAYWLVGKLKSKSSRTS